MANMLDFLLEELKSKGRYGDTELAHVNPAEKIILKLLGGAGTINPETGLKEYHGTLTGYNWDFSENPPAGHPMHHNETVQDIYNTAEDIYVGAGDLIEDAEDYYKQEVGDFLRDEGLIDDDSRTTYPYEPPPPPAPYGTGMSLDAPGEEISQDEFRKYFDPNTNTIKDPQGLVTWLKKVNPQLTEKDDSGNYIWSDKEIIDWVIKKGPNMFADATEIENLTKQFQLGAGKSRQKAGQATVKDLTTGGVGGMERFWSIWLWRKKYKTGGCFI